ncbi:3-oxoacyl-[acyl-carrier-protein] synthase 3 [Streptomyces sp. S4.7]|uniref:3-oxoacyl-ACP synthase III family protein n=1 Tax=Streptomyces sp. S4.7 TaxID=2705439 RepID=UPI0013974674|nr:3-oxoacyl-[acyl-carrier-protein] synthase III C-terminal domain-containing protein [Streptomyces sp. S4.7]QHY95518.1 3-oxoacyl-[acyl-carrier-protein] synthase 3 [Streptomyces sp. S4.7]
MRTVSLLELASYMPGDPVGTDYFLPYQGNDGELAGSTMFKAPSHRHQVSRDETPADMMEKAGALLAERIGKDALRGADAVITNTLLPEVPFTGPGAEVAHRLGVRADWVLDAHNGGCASFVHMLRLGRALIASGQANSALLFNVQNSAGPVMTQSEVRKLPEAVIPGDGCAAAYLAASDESPVLGIAVTNRGDYTRDCGLTLHDGRKYWEAGESQMHVGFTPDKVSDIVERGNRLVPEVVGRVCEQLDLKTDDIDLLITNQPNRMFLKQWQERLSIPQERHLDTFDRFGNLFGAGVPITLDHGIREGRVADGSLLMLAGFAHAGDFAGAAAVHWRAGGVRE